MRASAAILAALAVATFGGVMAVHAQTDRAAPGVEYAAALQDALDAMPPVDSLPASDARLERVRAPVRLAQDLGGDSHALDDVVTDLQRDPADLGDARTRLRALLDVVRLPPRSVAEDPSAPLSTLHQVYKDHDFDNLGRRPGESWINRVGSAIVDFFRNLLQHATGALGPWLTTLLVALLIAALIAYVVLRLHRASTPVLRGRLAAEPRTGALDADGEWTEAERAAAAGDHREAVRHAFRSALLAMAAHGRLRVDAAWTTSELLARARGDADLVAALAPPAASFDRAWYSGRPVSLEDWLVARERCQAVRSLAGRRRVEA